jgi:glycosyltransferase involved in cell wall biosynthesis
MEKRTRIAIVVSHPIQHFCPQYASFAKNENVVIKVFFASTLGYKKYHDANFGQEISWNNLYLDEFDHVFLNNGDIIQADKNIDAPDLDQSLGIFKPDLLIIYGYFQKLQRRAYRWALRFNVPIAYISDSEQRQKQSFIKRSLKYFYLRNFFSRINYFLSVGDANEEYYLSHGVPRSKIIRMHFPINIRMYEQSYAEKNGLATLIRKRYGVREGDIVLSVGGKLVDWKRQADIIKALQKLENDNLVFHLFIIGSGPMFDELKEMAKSLKKNKVHFTGFVMPEELPAYYAASAIYVHPAEIEPHSLSISEAIFMGCPAIISDRCGSYGPHDDVQVGKNGFVYRVGDIDELVNRIRAIINDPGLKASFGNTSHALATDFQTCSHKLAISRLSETLKS